jgi:hypothetical protein
MREQETGKTAANRKYIAILPDGSEIEGRTDDTGRITQSGIPIGKTLFVILEEEDED